jgi:3-hydroxyacyl-[acyl-carrier-protein] dehydratase
VVELLIPHRHPFLMVDVVEAFQLTPSPLICTARHVSKSEPVFQGHFPHMPIWPGALTMEGLAQSAVLLHVLRALCRDAEARGEDAGQALEALRNLDRGYRMHPGFRSGDVSDTRERLARVSRTMALGASVDMKFLRPVLPGCRLDYEVALTDDFEDRARFAGEASVDGQVVAKGSITAALTDFSPSDLR